MEWWGDNAAAVWLAVALLLGGAELLSLDLVLLMVAVGAIGGMVAALAGLTAPLQILVAAIVSVAMLAAVRPAVVRRLHHGPDLRHGPDALIGTHGLVVMETSDHAGQVKLGGEVWTARPYEERLVIPVGARVQVLEIRGATAYVTEVPELGA